MRSRTAVAAVVGAAGLALLGARGSLLQVPGIELGLAAALLSALLVAPALGIGAARRELARAPGGASAARAFAAAGLAAALPLAVLLGLAALRAAVATPCAPLFAAPLFLLVAVPSALLAAAVAVAAGFAARGRVGRASLLYGGAVLASLGTTLAYAYLGPAASAHDHLLGVWPGPLLDEALAADRRLVLFRLGSLAWTAAAVAAASLLAPARPRARRAGAAAALAGALAAALAARASGGGPVTRAELARALGGAREGPRCVVHFARERGPAEGERLLRDCEYDAFAVASALGMARAPRVTVWIHRSAAEKRRLVGAGGTSFTKPWLAEVHVQDEGIPHPLLRHELVHAIASAAAPGPLRVPARAWVVVDLGLVEGLAVAIDPASGQGGVHAWTRALRDQGRLPPLSALLGARFLRAAPARAYTAVGSFLRFLLDRDGPAPVLAAYRDDDVARAFGRPLAALEAEWQRFLDGVEVSPALAAAAEARFARESLFARACAREVAGLEAEAAADGAAGRAAEAERRLRRASRLSGGDPAPLRAAADSWAAQGDLERAAALVDEALRATDATQGLALRASLLAADGDLRWRSGDPASAAGRYREALLLVPEGAEGRALRAKLAAVTTPPLGDATGPWLLGVGDRALALARVAASEAPLARYLLARAELARGAPARAVATLAGLDLSGLPGDDLRQEARRMQAEALCRAGHFDRAIAAWEAITRAAADDAPRAHAEDSARRCRFERDEYGAPVASPGDWLGPPAAPR